MIKYYVRTTLDRPLDETYNQIDYELLIDKEHKPVESFIKQLEIISENDSVLLEDDLELCQDFKNRIEEVIKKYPDRIIQFFTSPHKYFQTREEQYFVFNQCTYYPKGISKKIAEEMKKHSNLSRQYDTIENKALEELGIKHIQYRPCLVQHLNYDSLLNNLIGNKRTPFFVGYLDKLNINYNKMTFIHTGRLVKEMQSHIESKRKEWQDKKDKIIRDRSDDNGN